MSMFELLHQMAQFSPRAALSSYNDLSNWSLELAGIKLLTLEKHQTTLINLSEMIWDLGALLEIE